IANGCDSVKECNGCEACVSPVQDAHLSGAVLIEIIGINDVKTDVRSGKKTLHVRRTFDGEEVIGFRHYHELVFEARLVPYLVNIVFWKSRHDSVDQRIAECSIVVHPRPKPAI